KATVSRFLNPGAKLLSPEIAARVEGAIRELGYRPSPMAQALKRGRSRLIGLVVADVTNPYSVAVLQGAEKACRDAGYMVMLFNSEVIRGVSSRIDREAAFRACMPERGQTFECNADDALALDKALQALRLRARGDACAVISANAVITLRLAASAARLGLTLGQ